MNEFSLIDTYFAPLTNNDSGALGLKDDAALISVAPGKQLVITKDAMTAGVHFFPTDTPYNLARKLLRVNLSDLAAMGATPLYYLLGCIFPKDTTESWIAEFTAGLAADNREFGVHLLGGDTVSQQGPLTLSLTAIGQVETGAALTRNSAKAGEDVYVSGTIGDAALALQIMLEKCLAPSEETKTALLSRYHLPQPRTRLGAALFPFASSAMDISDGLLQDAGHIARYSQKKLVLERDAIPLSPAAQHMIEAQPHYYQAAVTGGDDYELLFTAPYHHRAALQQLSEATATRITRIGRVEKGNGVALLDKAGREIIIPLHGYQHF